jgi:hypothetical protein
MVLQNTPIIYTHPVNKNFVITNSQNTENLFKQIIKMFVLMEML